MLNESLAYSIDEKSLIHVISSRVNIDIPRRSEIPIQILFCKGAVGTKVNTRRHEDTTSVSNREKKVHGRILREIHSSSEDEELRRLQGI